MSGIAERVAAGAALLDERQPGWWQRINLDSLDLGSCVGCILGQLYARAGLVHRDKTNCPYFLGLRALELTEHDGDLYGFDSPALDPVTVRTEWVRVITEHRRGRAAVTTCTCGKAQYATRRAAKRAARLVEPRRAKIRVYRCGCWWHLTSVPTATVTAYREWHSEQAS